jgi:hypothetical protein
LVLRHGGVDALPEAAQLPQVEHATRSSSSSTIPTWCSGR